MEEIQDLRPGTLLADFRRHTGTTGDNFSRNTAAKVYALIDAPDEVTGEHRARWVNLAINPDPESALIDSYGAYIELLDADHQAGKTGSDVRNLTAMVLVAYGEGRIVARNETTDEMREKFPKLAEAAALDGFADARVIHLMSPEGMAVCSTMHYADHEPFSETWEVWTEADDYDPSEMAGALAGAVPSAMTACLTILVMLNSAVEDGTPPTIEGLIQVANRHRGDEGGYQIVGLLREFIGKQIDQAATLGALLHQLDDDDEGGAL